MHRKPITRHSKEQWRRIIAAQETTGQSVGAYCHGKDFSEKSFYMWRRKLGTQTSDQCGTFVEVTPSSWRRGRGQPGALVVHTPGGYRLEVPRGLAADTIRAVLKALVSL
jgi:hypothetical protein